MTKILFRSPIDDDEYDELKKNFPSIEFLIEESLEEAQWPFIEVLYSSKLSPQELAQARRLRWIHCPIDSIDELCFEQIKEKGDILLSIGTRRNVHQTAEFVLACILHFAKHISLWKQAPSDPLEFSDWALKDSMWTLQNKRVLQIGLGKVGTEITRLLSLLGAECWGVSKRYAFQPYCKKQFVFSELTSVLPAVDIVVVALPQKSSYKKILGSKELNLIKKGSLLVIVDKPGALDEKALEQFPTENHLRGVVIDAWKSFPPKTSPLWNRSNILLTPNISSYPPDLRDRSFSLFKKNLYSYLSQRYSEMRNLLTEDPL